jgi:hypothetical protein
VGDGLIGDIGDRGEHVLPDGRRGVDDDDPVVGHHERGVVAPAGDPVEASAELLDVVSEPLEVLAAEVRGVVLRGIGGVIVTGPGKSVVVDTEELRLVGRGDGLLGWGTHGFSGVS